MRNKIIVLIILLIVFIPDGITQCSQCKLIAEQASMDDEILGVEGSNINTAILYIMAVPYIILTFLFRKQIARLFKRSK
jgi:hypothetical protein